MNADFKNLSGIELQIHGILYQVAVCPSPFPICVYDHIVQHGTIVLSDLPGINYSIHNWLGCLCGKKIADFQPGDFWNCMFADLALGSK